MTLVLAGPHRSGKSTLARAYAEATGMEYRPFQTSAITQAAGLNLKHVRSLRQRLVFQGAILKGARAFFQCGGRFITDRSPLDFAAYLLADVRDEELSPEEDSMIEEFVGDCMALTNQTVSQGFVLPPVLPYVADPLKPHASRSYQAHHFYTLWGLVCSGPCLTPFRVIDGSIVKLEARVAFMVSYSEAMARASKAGMEGVSVM